MKGAWRQKCCWRDGQNNKQRKLVDNAPSWGNTLRLNKYKWMACHPYLVRMLDMDTEAQLLQYTTFSFDHLVLDSNVVLVQHQRFDCSATHTYTDMLTSTSLGHKSHRWIQFSWGLQTNCPNLRHLHFYLWYRPASAVLTTATACL